MSSLAIAYGIAWSAVALYLVWLGRIQYRLTKRIEALDSESNPPHKLAPPSRAA